MLKTEAKKLAHTFDYKASEKMEDMVETLLDSYEKDGLSAEGLKGVANILLRKLRDADSGQVAHSQALERVMRGVSRAIDHSWDMHYIADTIRRGADKLEG